LCCSWNAWSTIYSGYINWFICAVVSTIRCWGSARFWEHVCLHYPWQWLLSGRLYYGLCSI